MRAYGLSVLIEKYQQGILCCSTRLDEKCQQGTLGLQVVSHGLSVSRTAADVFWQNTDADCLVVQVSRYALLGGLTAKLSVLVKRLEFKN